jgi:hypothetical protein
MESTTTLSQLTKSKIEFNITWAKYGAILSFINLGLGLLQMIVNGIKGDASFFGSLLSFIISAVISIVMAVNLLKYSKLCKDSLTTSDSYQLQQALHHLKMYFTIMGIIFIIGISLAVIGILIGLLVALASL